MKHRLPRIAGKLSRFGIAVLGLPVIVLFSPSVINAQDMQGRRDVARNTWSALEGEWVLIGRNHDPNDQMRIAIGGVDGLLIGGVDVLLTRVPRTMHSGFKVGQRLWTNLSANGALKVRGSNGRYYRATLTPLGRDTLRLSIDRSTKDSDQLWVRAGPLHSPKPSGSPHPQAHRE